MRDVPVISLPSPPQRATHPSASHEVCNCTYVAPAHRPFLCAGLVVGQGSGTTVAYKQISAAEYAAAPSCAGGYATSSQWLTAQLSLVTNVTDTEVRNWH